jgi:hypothetical protein
MSKGKERGIEAYSKEDIADVHGDKDGVTDHRQVNAVRPSDQPERNEMLRARGSNRTRDKDQLVSLTG